MPRDALLLPALIPLSPPFPLLVAKTDPCFRGSYAPTLELQREGSDGRLRTEKEERYDLSRKEQDIGSPSIRPTPRKFFPRLGAFVDDGGWRR